MLNVKEDTYFEIVGLKGKYKIKKGCKAVWAYDVSGNGILNNRGIVNGLYESLVAGRWKIKK